ncbi:MAG TPA: hypothetical protein VL330_26230 [Actinomycetes bacterium]|nr:hypothetical protein [Actinomycetes bacterium]
MAIATAEDPQGRSLQVKIYGRDAWDGQLLASAWSSLWYRGDTPHLVPGRRELAEHEAFVTLLAERGGVAVLPVVTAGMASERDALLVTEASGRPLGTLEPHEVGDELLNGIWGNAARLHALGVAHRRLDAGRIVVRPDGTPAFGDFGGSEVAADDADTVADRAQALVATALGRGAGTSRLGRPGRVGERRPPAGAAPPPARGGRTPDPARGSPPRTGTSRTCGRPAPRRPGSSFPSSRSCGGCRSGRSAWPPWSRWSSTRSSPRWPRSGSTT